MSTLERPQQVYQEAMGNPQDGKKFRLLTTSNPRAADYITHKSVITILRAGYPASIEPMFDFYEKHLPRSQAVEDAIKEFVKNDAGANKALANKLLRVSG